jgi:DNA ligase-1
MTLVLAEVARTSAAVAGTAARTEKVAALAELLMHADPGEGPVLAGLLAGRPRQGRVGVGWAALSGAAAVAPAASATLTVSDVDRALSDLAVASGRGSVGARFDVLRRLFEAATAPEQDLLRRLLSGELHQGAAEAIVTDALAAAAGIPATVVRRGLMMSGDLAVTAAAALTGEPAAARAALGALTLRVGTPVRPMLASPAESVAAAIGEIDGPASVEYKLDGARIQVHRDGGDVAVFTRTLHEVTSRVPELVAAVRGLRVRSVVLDGETLVLGEDGRPRSFQQTMARFATASDNQPAGSGDRTAQRVLRPWFFDCLHLDGTDLLDEPLADRQRALTRIGGDLVMPAVLTEDPEVAAAFSREALDARHEGVVIKDLAAPYAAGRRGRSWLKVKPVSTLDLVVTAAEWGHGRRTGLLSNLHLGARDPSGGPPVMVGKTFKGLTDALLAWQTRELGARGLSDNGWVVVVRPELVVEIELDGVQVSPRYPGGVALRFARVLRYRPDKAAADADTIDAVRALLGPPGPAGQLA